MKSNGKRGVTLERGAPGFDAAVLGTNFNAREPGRRPAVVVQANDVLDVIAAVRRAGRGRKVSICSGGHSWAQNHIREDGLLIDVSRLNAITVDRIARTIRSGRARTAATWTRPSRRPGSSLSPTRGPSA